jgi:phage terminase large subunit
MEQSYDEEYKRRYLYGEWGSFEGQIFKDFDIDRDVCDLSTVNRERFQYIVGGYDDGYRNPACLLVIGITRDNEAFILEELYEKEKSPDSIIKMIDGMNYKYRMRRIYADPSAIGFIEMGRNMGLPIVSGDNEVEAGISKIKAMFYNEMIKIDKSCRNSIREFESYRYARDKVMNNLTEKPVKKDDHSCDAFRYGLTDFNPFKKKRILSAGIFK